jgi:hypothetical protein
MARKKVVVVTALAVFGLSPALIQWGHIVSWLFLDHATVSATLTWVPCESPSLVEDAFRAARESMSFDAVEKTPEFAELLSDYETDNEKAAIRRAVRRVLLSLALRSQWALPSSCTSLRSFVTGSIRNDSTKSVDDVRIAVPSLSIISTQREGEAPKILSARDVGVVGRLGPTESVEVKLWTSSSPMSLDEERVRLTYADGVGVVRLDAPAGSFVRWLERSWVPLLISFGIVCLGALWTWYFLRQSRVQRDLPRAKPGCR